MVKYYPMLRKTAEGNDCGRITDIIKRLSLQNPYTEFPAVY